MSNGKKENVLVVRKRVIIFICSAHASSLTEKVQAAKLRPKCIIWEKHEGFPELIQNVYHVQRLSEASVSGSLQMFSLHFELQTKMLIEMKQIQ